MNTFYLFNYRNFENPIGCQAAGDIRLARLTDDFVEETAEVVIKGAVKAGVEPYEVGRFNDFQKMSLI